MSPILSVALLTFVITSPRTDSCWATDGSAVMVLDRAMMETLPERVSVLGAPSLGTQGGVEAASFDGVDDALNVECNPVCGASEFVIEVLIAPTVGGPAEQRFLHIEDEAGRRLLLELRMVTPDRWTLDTFLHENGDSRLTLIDRTKLHPAGEWHWVALRYDGATMSHFVNGIRELEGRVAVKPFVAGRMSLGARLNRVSWYQGLIREVRFHRTALTDDALQRR